MSTNLIAELYQIITDNRATQQENTAAAPRSPGPATLIADEGAGGSPLASSVLPPAGGGAVVGVASDTADHSSVVVLPYYFYGCDTRLLPGKEPSGPRREAADPEESRIGSNKE